MRTRAEAEEDLHGRSSRKKRLPRPLAREGEGEGRDRRGHVLFIDARKLGRMVDRTHRELTDEDIARIANTYHAWRGEKISPSPLAGEKNNIPSPSTGEGEGEGEYKDIPRFCKSASLGEVRKHGYVLTPGRYVGAEAQTDDGEPFEKKMRRLTAQLQNQLAESTKLDDQIRKNLRALGYDI